MDRPRRMRHQALEQRRLAAMRPDIARVEQSPPASFDQHRIGVVGGVIHEEGRDREWSDLQRDPIGQLIHVGVVGRKRCRVRDERRRRTQDASCGPSHHYRQGRVRVGNKAPVIHVPMRDDKGEQSGVRRAQTRHIRHKPDRIIR